MDLQLQLVLCDCVIINCQLPQEITGLIRNAHVMRRGMRRKIGMELPNCCILALLCALGDTIWKDNAFAKNFCNSVYLHFGSTVQQQKITMTIKI
jgi:hypothetical protein